MLAKDAVNRWECTTRLETRTKESSMRASRTVGKTVRHNESGIYVRGGQPPHHESFGPSGPIVLERGC
jgi:hypothetical protein